MVKIKGILLDIDQTISRNDQTISDRTIAAIRQVEASGCKIGLCTGRQAAFLYRVLFPIFQRSGYHVVAGGGQLVNRAGEVVKSFNLPATTVAELQRLAENTGANLISGQGETIYTWRASAITSLQENVWAKQVELWPKTKKQECPLVVIIPLTPSIERQLQQWQAAGKLSYKTMTSRKGVTYADVTGTGINKAVMAREWAKIQNLELTEVAAVGDGLNDLEVVKSVGWGVAMGNAVAELKAVADEVIGNNADDGLAVWLEKIAGAYQQTNR
jgi:Cof subfamily protein (haloacid dehalogenase superfamily)